MIDLVHAFSMMVQEEIEKIIEENEYTEWTIFDMGRSPAGPHDLVNAVFIIRIRLPKPEGFIEELANPWRGREHFFRVETSLHDGSFKRDPLPWERAYLGKSHVVLSVWHSRCEHSVSWTVGFKKPEYSDPVGRSLMERNQEVAVHNVCKRIVWHIDDPKCQKRLADKLHRALGIYLMTCKALPDH
jgi:hypothetical protein